MLKVNSQLLKVHDKTSPQGRAGFVVLYTVLIATIILAITIGIALIAYNEVILSSSAAEGGEAFFAADSGAECALYWDRQSPSQFSEFIDNSLPSDILCGGVSNPLSLDSQNSDQVNFFLNIYNENIPIGCAKVSVNKGATDSEGNLITEIVSLGYNIDCITLQNFDTDPSTFPLPPRTIQRAIRVTY